MEKRVPQIVYCGVSGSYWMLYDVAISFSSIYLLSFGYTNTQVGYVLCAGFLLGAIGQMVLARSADRAKRLSPAGFLLITLLLTAAALVGLVLCAEKSSALLLFYILLIAAVMMAQPFTFSLAFYLERCGVSVNVGAARGIGSLCYAVISVILGVWVSRTGCRAVTTAAFLVLGIFLLLLAYLLRRYPLRGCATAPEEKSVGLLRRYRGFVFLLAGTAVLSVGHGIVNNFMFQIAQQVGGTERDLGAFGAFVAVMELPAMLGFACIAKRFSVRKLLFFSAGAYIAKMTAISLAGSIPALYGAFSLQSLSFALFAPANIYYIGRLMNAKDANRGQAYSTAMTSVGNILAGLLGGMLIDRFAVGGAMTAAIATAAAGTLLIAVMYAKTSKGEIA